MEQLSKRKKQEQEKAAALAAAQAGTPGSRKVSSASRKVSRVNAASPSAVNGARKSSQGKAHSQAKTQSPTVAEKALGAAASGAKVDGKEKDGEDPKIDADKKTSWTQRLQRRSSKVASFETCDCLSTS